MTALRLTYRYKMYSSLSPSLLKVDLIYYPIFSLLSAVELLANRNASTVFCVQKKKCWAM